MTSFPAQLTCFSQGNKPEDYFLTKQLRMITACQYAWSVNLKDCWKCQYFSSLFFSLQYCLCHAEQGAWLTRGTRAILSLLPRQKFVSAPEREVPIFVTEVPTLQKLESSLLSLARRKITWRGRKIKIFLLMDLQLTLLTKGELALLELNPAFLQWGQEAADPLAAGMLGTALWVHGLIALCMGRPREIPPAQRLIARGWGEAGSEGKLFHT